MVVIKPPTKLSRMNIEGPVSSALLVFRWLSKTHYSFFGAYRRRNHIGRAPARHSATQKMDGGHSEMVDYSRRRENAL